MKSIVIEIINSTDWTNFRLYPVKKRISELEESNEEFIQNIA